MSDNSVLREAIERLPLPVLWTRLNIPGTINLKQGKCLVCSPLREDRHPSFSIYAQGRRWRDHATGEGGDSLDFFKAVTGRTGRDAIEAFIDLVGR